MATPAANVFDSLDSGTAPAEATTPATATSTANPFDALDAGTTAAPAPNPTQSHDTIAFPNSGAPDASKGPQSDFGDWVVHTLRNFIPSNVNAITGKQTMTPDQMSPGAARFDKTLNNLTGKTEEENQTPAQRAASEVAEGPLGQLGRAEASIPGATRAAQAVMGVVNLGAPLAGAYEGFASPIEGEAAAPAATAAPTRTLATPPSTQELLNVGKAPPAAAPAAPAVEHTDMGQGLHSLKTADGETLAQETGPYLQLKRQDVATEAQGQGQGTAMIKAGADLAKDKGLTLGSDVSMSPQAIGSWQKYARENGVELQQNPSTPSQAQPGGLVSNDPRKPVFEVKPPGPQLNVGMNVEGGAPLTHDQVVKAIESTGAKVTNSTVHTAEGGEPTVVATTDRPLTAAEGNGLAAQLKQNAIPQRAAGAATGEMFGPGNPEHPEWNQFNGQYFMDHTGKTIEAPTPEAAAVPVKLDGGAAPTDRAARADTLKALNLNGQMRESALSGDLQATSDDVQTAKLTEGGEQMRQQLADERTALQDRANDLQQRSGGTPGTDSQALEDRGHVMSAPLEAAHERIDTAMNAMYEQAKAEAKARGAVVGTTNVDAWLKKAEADGEFDRSDAAEAFKRRVDAAREKTGTDGGSFTVDQADNLRKRIGKMYDYQAADLNYGLKDALDSDVAAAGGADLYNQARALRTFRQDNFDTPKGVSALIANAKAGRLGLNRPVPFEKIPDFVSNLPNDQFNHLINTYQEIGQRFPDMADQSAAAIAEIRAHQMARINKAGNSAQGIWNAKAVSAEIAKNGPKIQRVWGQDGQQAIRELQQGGEILRNDNNYKGAAVQHANLASMALKGAGKMAEAAGAHLAGLPGWIAGKAAEAGLNKIDAAWIRRGVADRFTNLADEPTAAAAAAPAVEPTPTGPMAPKGGPAGGAPFKLAQPEPLSAKIPGQRGGPKPTGPSAIEQIKPYLQDDELPAKRDTAQRLVDFYHSLPPTEEKAAFAAAGATMKDWYRGGAEAIGGWFKQDAPRFTALLAADSPQYPVASNLAESVNIWKAWHEAGRPTDRAAISKILSDQGAHLHGGAGAGESTILNNIHNALTAEDPSAIVLSGPKVHSFYKNLMGHVNEVTNDGWQAKGSSVDPAALGGSKNAAGDKPGKGTTYVAMSAKTREAAALLSNISGEKWAPDQIQAGEWSFIKSAWELADKTGRSIPELLKSGELNDEVIANTPSYQQLLDQHAGKLQSIGLEQPAGVRGESGGGTPSEATTAARETLRSHLFKGAQRLEAYRQYLKAGGKPGTGPGAKLPSGAPGSDVPF